MSYAMIQISCNNNFFVPTDKAANN